MNDKNIQINNIAIIGLGLLGGSIAKTIKKNNAQIKISAFDKNEILDIAFKDKTIDAKLMNIEEAINYNLIILCLPTDLSLKAFKKLIPLIKEDTIITDVCGIKGVFEIEWEKSYKYGVYIGGHPMTGKEKGGYQNSDSLLFENAVYIISEKAKGNIKEDDFLQFVKLLGARAIYLDPFLHDDVVANVSHLPQLLSVALLSSVASKKKDVNYLDFAAGGFKDLTRIASSDYNIWKSILELNKNEITESIITFQTYLNEIKNILKKEDYDSLKFLFEDAKTKRESINDNRKGFIHPLFDLYIFINDEPGALYKITKILSVNKINIKDIELQKIRENIDGTFRLSFSSQKELIEAKKLLKKAGFTINN